MSLSNDLFHVYSRQGRPAHRNRHAGPVIPQADDRDWPWAGLVILTLGAGMCVVGMVSVALLLIGLFGA